MSKETTLKEYLKDHKLSYRKFSKITGIEYSLLHKYASGARTPKLKNALILEEATGGLVKVKSWALSEI